MFSKTTAAEEVSNSSNISGAKESENCQVNPIQFSAIGEGCSEYDVKSKSFISTCNQEMEERVLDAARKLINDATGCQDVLLDPDTEPPTPNPKNGDQWHHKYLVSFKVLAKSDPKDYLNDFFGRNILQLEDAAVRIAYFETSLLQD